MVLVGISCFRLNLYVLYLNYKVHFISELQRSTFLAIWIAENLWHRTDEMCSIRRFKSNILPLLNILHRLFPTRSNVKLLQTFGLFQWFFFYYAAAKDFHNCFVWMNKGKLSVSIDGKSKACDTWRFLDIYNSIVRYIVYG